MGDGHHTSCWVPKVLPSDAARPSGKHWPQAKHFRGNSKERAGSQSTIPALRQRGSHMAFLTSESMWVWSVLRTIARNHTGYGL